MHIKHYFEWPITIGEMLEFLDMNDSGTRTRDTVKATPRGKHKVISTSTKDIKTKSSDVTRERRKLRTK